MRVEGYSPFLYKIYMYSYMLVWLFPFVILVIRTLGGLQNGIFRGSGGVCFFFICDCDMPDVPAKFMG